MGSRPGWHWLVLLCMGCQSLAPGEPVEHPAQACELWEQGQAAMHRKQPEQAIACYQQSLAVDPSLVRSHLSLAAAYLETGDEAGACPHLGAYVAVHPEHLQLRAKYAELLFRCRQHRQAHAEFERYLTAVQEHDGPGIAALIHCHTRLMEIAEAEEDEYAEHLNRGIGLFLLARQRADLPDPDGELSAEGLLCQAAGELMLARMERPDEARPCWYLYEVWSRLAQRQPAMRWLRQAVAIAPLSYLTPAELRRLQLACRDQEAEVLRR